MTASRRMTPTEREVAEAMLADAISNGDLGSTAMLANLLRDDDALAGAS